MAPMPTSASPIHTDVHIYNVAKHVASEVEGSVRKFGLSYIFIFRRTNGNP